MRTVQTAVFSLVALVLVGCGGERYGASEAPTPPQQQAAASLLASAGVIERAARGGATVNEWLAVHAALAQLPDLALLRPQPSGFDAAEVGTLDTSCARGSSQTGFVFDDCRLPSGLLNGQVKVEAPGVRFELRSPSRAPRTTFRLEGPVTVNGRAVSGRVVSSLGSELLDQGNGVMLQEGPPGIQTIIVFDLRFDDADRVDGTAEVMVSSRGGQEEALFTFQGDRVSVRNSADAR
jgi:hypothetical protein